MMNLDYVKLHDALQLISKTCNQSSTCYSCPLADSIGTCKITGRHMNSDSWRDKPKEWKLNDTIKLFLLDNSVKSNEG